MISITLSGVAPRVRLRNLEIDDNYIIWRVLRRSQPRCSSSSSAPHSQLRVSGLRRRHWRHGLTQQPSERRPRPSGVSSGPSVPRCMAISSALEETPTGKSAGTGSTCATGVRQPAAPERRTAAVATLLVGKSGRGSATKLSLSSQAYALQHCSQAAIAVV